MTIEHLTDRFAQALNINSRNAATAVVDLRMETTGRKELVRWVLSWMPDVRVLAPKSLRDRVALKLEEGLRLNAANGRMPNQTLHANREQARGR